MTICPNTTKTLRSRRRRRRRLKGGCALASRGYVFREYDDDLSAGDSKVTFADKAKFKDNYCDVRHSSIEVDVDHH